jgi:hypothetical protein
LLVDASPQDVFPGGRSPPPENGPSKHQGAFPQAIEGPDEASVKSPARIERLGL